MIRDDARILPVVGFAQAGVFLSGRDRRPYSRVEFELDADGAFRSTLTSSLQLEEGAYTVIAHVRWFENGTQHDMARASLANVRPPVPPVSGLLIALGKHKLLVGKSKRKSSLHSLHHLESNFVRCLYCALLLAEFSA